MANNLLDKSSIILTPTAYKNGEALCVKPSDASGDFTFSRNSAATRVNAQGLVENVQILSSNLVQNGDFSEEGVQEVSNGSFSQEGVEQITNGSFDTDSNWNKASGVTISDGKANAAFGSSGNILRQSLVTFDANKTYKYEFTISNYVSGNLKFASFIGAVNESGNGTYVGYGKPNGTGVNNMILFGSFEGSIDNVSVREVGQDWTLSSQSEIVEDAAKVVSTDGSFQYIKQNGFTSTQGKTIKFTIEVTDIQIGQLKVSFTGGTTNTNIPNSVGTHILYIPNDGSIGELTIGRVGGITDVTITNISVKEVGQNWVLDANWSIAEDKAVSDGSVNGFIRTSTNLFENGKTYKVGITVSNMTTGKVTYPYDGAGGTFITTNGDFSQTYYADDTNRCWIYGNNGFDGSITNISVIEITDDTNLPRINYEGFSYQDALGSEEVVNGDFATDTNWIKNGQVTIGGGVAYFDSDGTFTQIAQSISGVSGKNVKVVIEITEYTQGTLKVLFSGGTQQNLPNSVGVHTLYFNNADSDTINIARLGGVTNLKIDNVSVKEYLGQEVVPDSGCGSWLFEPQSTNLVTQSELFSDASWSKGRVSITPNTLKSPDGSINASTLSVINATGGEEYLRFQTNDSNEATCSFYVKKGNWRYITLRSVNASVFDFDTETFTFIGTNEIVSFKKLQNGWYRLKASSPTRVYCSIGFAVNATNPAGGSGVNGSNMYIWGAQLEQQSYATSYIPTSGSSVTRNQDLCTNGGSLASINSTEGTLYFEGAALVGGSLTQISLSDGTNDNGVKLRFDTNPDRFTIFLRGNAGTFAIKTITGVTQTDNNKIALVWDITNFRIWLNGVEAGTIATNDLPVGLDTLNFANNTGISNFQGKTKALAVWKEALSDAELTELTTI